MTKNWKLAVAALFGIALLLDGRVWGSDCSKAQEVLDKIMAECATECPDCVCDVQCGETFIEVPPAPVPVPETQVLECEDCWEMLDVKPSATWQIDVGAGVGPSVWYPEVGARYKRWRLGLSYVKVSDSQSFTLEGTSSLRLPADSCGGNPVCNSPLFRVNSVVRGQMDYDESFPVAELSYVVWKSKR